MRSEPANRRRRPRCALALGALLAAVAPALGDGAAPGLAEAPLAPRSVATGTTRFTPLLPERTGLVTANNYDDPKMWAEHFQEFKFGAIGTGVAIGDYDGDGRPDVFVVNKTGPCRLFRNLGDWRFEDVTAQAGLAAGAGGWTGALKGLIGGGDSTADTPEAWKQGATFADVNNDGRLDLYVCRFGAPNWLFMNQGDGTFKEEAAARGLAVVDASGQGAFCDFDRDGWLDVYVQTNMRDAAKSPQGQRDYLFKNNGDGTFTDVTDRAGIRGLTQGHAAIWWDYDADGWPDLYVANDFAPPDSLYRNRGDGTFADVLDRVLPRTPHSSMGADLGDVNNDGLVDFLVADMAATSHEKDQRGMARIRTLLTSMSDDAPGAPQFMRSALYLNTGLGRMAEAGQLAGLAATDWTWSVRFEDLDNDGRLDVFVTNGMVRELHNADLVQDISSRESIAEGIRVEKASPVLAETNLAFRNLGGLRFEETGRTWGLDRTGVSFGAAFGDLDGDGDLDVIHANYEAAATVLRNDSPAGHRVIVALRGTRSNRFGIGAVVRLETAAGVQVRPLVLARGYLSSSEPVAHFGLGEDTILKSLTVEWPSGHRQTFTDLPADRRYTITEPEGTAPASPGPTPQATQFTDVTASLQLGVTVAEETSPDPSAQPLLPFRFDRRGPALAMADVNGDGRDDAVIGGTTKTPAQLLLAGLAGFTRTPLPPSPALDDGPVLLFDANGDNHPDLLRTRAGTNRAAGSPDYQPTLLLNDGGGNFTLSPAALPPLPLSVGAAAAADFDRDGRLDVFVGARVIPGRYPLAPRSVLLRNAGGRFEDMTDTLAPGLRSPGLVTAAVWSDLDVDGWPDLVVALEWGTIRYFHNDAGRGFSDRSVPAGLTAAGWWTSLATADFNHDGRPDLVAGNVGLNTPYRASPDEPTLAYFGDFGGSTPLLVEGYFENGKVYPRRTRAELGTRISSLLRRYPKNNDYAKATLAEIFTEPRLNAARRFVATELRSGVYLSQPDGTWRFTALPHAAQIAPLQGLAAGDLDGDGHADLYAVQNSFAPILSIGRFDGGVSQLLRGDGRGDFTPVPPAACGLLVPGDAKALATADLDADGWPDFVVTRNQSAALAFRNTPQPGRHSFRVVLQGPPGNPTAIGARLVLELANGTTQSAEIQSTSSYYSQSSAAAFFGYPAANPPRRLTVHWPDGRATTHDLSTSLPPPWLLIGL